MAYLKRAFFVTFRFPTTGTKEIFHWILKIHSPAWKVLDIIRHTGAGRRALRGQQLRKALYLEANDLREPVRGKLKGYRDTSSPEFPVALEMWGTRTTAKSVEYGP